MFGVVVIVSLFAFIFVIERCDCFALLDIPIVRKTINSVLLSTCLTSLQPCLALEDPPTSNILTNKVLETIRYMDQKDDDPINIKTTNKVLLLIPIVNIQSQVDSIRSSLQTKSSDSVKMYFKLLDSNEYSTKALKKVFNRYADNIFYSDPNRANLYLGGGAVPNTFQTTQYLIRNDILTQLLDVKDDLQSLLTSDSSPSEQEYLDAIDDCNIVLKSFDDYLQYADKNDLKLAKETLTSSKE